MEENKSLGHIMLDLETFGTENDAVICSIGAVEFDITTGTTGREFYQKIDIQSCLNAGLTVTGQTILWWLKKSEEARRELYDAKPEQLMTVLGALTRFIREVGYESYVWGNSNRFDMGILETAYKKSYLPVPWDFRNERDVRTLVSLKPYLKHRTPFEGVAHHPVDDCRHQIKYCSLIWRDLLPKTLTFVLPEPDTTPEEAREYLRELINKYKKELKFDTEEWHNMPEGLLQPKTPKNVEEARKTIESLIAEYKDELLLDKNWIIKNILLSDEYVD